MNRLLILLIAILCLKTALIEFGVGGVHLPALTSGTFEQISSDAYLEDPGAIRLHWIVSSLLFLSALICLVWPLVWMPLVFAAVLQIVAIQVQGSFILTPPDFALHAMFFAVWGAIIMTLWRTAEGIQVRERRWSRILARVGFIAFGLYGAANLAVAIPTIWSMCDAGACVMSTRALQLTMWLLLCFVVGVIGVFNRGRALMVDAVAFSLFGSVGLVFLYVRFTGHATIPPPRMELLVLSIISLLSFVRLAAIPIGWGRGETETCEN